MLMQSADCGFNFDWNQGLCGWQQTWANILAHHFSSVRPKCFRERERGEGGINDCHLVCQQHGSSRKVTLKSSCGHSMVPTARAYAGLCQELQTALTVGGTRSVFAQLGHSVWISEPSQCISREEWFIRYQLLVVLHNRGLSWWKHAQSSQLGKVSAIIWQISSLPLAHAC